MKSNYFILLIFSVFLLMSCVTLSEPKNEADNLCIGIIIHTGEGYRNYSGANVNGSHMSGVELILRNINSDEEYTLKTKKNGLFYTNILPEGTYEVKRFYIKVTRGSAWADAYYTLPSGGVILNIDKGKVNNFGVINWDSKFGETSDFKFFQLHDNVIEEFKTQFPKSDWLRKEIINVPIEEI